MKEPARKHVKAEPKPGKGEPRREHERKKDKTGPAFAMESSVPVRGTKRKGEPGTEIQEESGFLGGVLRSAGSALSSAFSRTPRAERAVYKTPKKAAKSADGPTQRAPPAPVQEQPSRGASPAPSVVSRASAVDGTRDIGLSAYFSGTRESYGRLITRIQGAIGAMQVVVEGEGLSGFPSRNSFKKLLAGLAREGGLEALTPDESGTMAQVDEFFRTTERQFYDATGRESEKKFNHDFSLAFQIAGQVARRQLQYATETKNQRRIGAGLWYFVTAPEPQSCAALATQEVLACYNKLNELGLTSDVKAASLPQPVTSYLNKVDKPCIDRESSLVVHRVAALTLREKVSEFVDLVDSGCVSQGSQATCVAKLLRAADLRANWAQSEEFGKLGWPVVGHGTSATEAVETGAAFEEVMQGLLSAIFRGTPLWLQLVG